MAIMRTKHTQTIFSCTHHRNESELLRWSSLIVTLRKNVIPSVYRTVSGRASLRIVYVEVTYLAPTGRNHDLWTRMPVRSILMLFVINELVEQSFDVSSTSHDLSVN